MTQSYRILIAAAIFCCTLFTLSTWTACKKDPCRDTTCLNGGQCYKGSCKCPTGFTGPGCEIDIRPNFRGSWEGRRCNSNNFNNTERLVIKTADSVGYVKLVYEGYDPIYGKVSGNLLSIDRQGLFPSGSSGGFGISYIKGTMTNVLDTITYHYDYKHYVYGRMEPFPEDCNGRYMRD